MCKVTAAILVVSLFALTLLFQFQVEEMYQRQQYKGLMKLIQW